MEHVADDAWVEEAASTAWLLQAAVVGFLLQHAAVAEDCRTNAAVAADALAAADSADETMAAEADWHQQACQCPHHLTHRSRSQEVSKCQTHHNYNTYHHSLGKVSKWVSEWVWFNGTSTQFRSLAPSLTRKADTELPTAKESQRYINLANAI